MLELGSGTGILASALAALGTGWGVKSLCASDRSHKALVALRGNLKCNGVVVEGEAGTEESEEEREEEEREAKSPFPWTRQKLAVELKLLELAPEGSKEAVAQAKEARELYDCVLSTDMAYDPGLCTLLATFLEGFLGGEAGGDGRERIAIVVFEERIPETSEAFVRRLQASPCVTSVVEEIVPPWEGGKAEPMLVGGRVRGRQRVLVLR